MKRLKAAMTLLIANDGPLAAEWLDHELGGDWEDHRECHAKGDLLLIYRLDADKVTFVRWHALRAVWAITAKKNPLRRVFSSNNAGVRQAALFRRRATTFSSLAAKRLRTWRIRVW